MYTLRPLLPTPFLPANLRALLLVGVIALLPSAAPAADGEVPGTFSVTTETRTVLRTIDSIEMSGPINLVVRQSTLPSLVIKSEQRLLDRIRTHQDGRTLSTSVTGTPPMSYRPIRIELSLPAVQLLRLAGSGYTELSGFSGERFKLEQRGTGDTVIHATYQNIEAALSGSGDLTVHAGTATSISLSMSGRGDARIEGSAKTFTASLRGAGDLNAANLVTETVTLALSGSGDASVKASQAATIVSRGRGDVVVSGQPPQKVTSRSGSGSVVFR